MGTSVKFKDVQFSTPKADGSAGDDWRSYGESSLEGTTNFQGSDATTTEYKNIKGSDVESSKSKGTNNIATALSDLDPDAIAYLTGGTVTESNGTKTLTPPRNQNIVIERSAKYITEKGIVKIYPRVAIDAYEMFADDDIHKYMVSGVVLLPSNPLIDISQEITLDATEQAKNDILSFTLDEETGAATIGAGTIDIEVVNGTDVTALAPIVIADQGTIVTPNSGKTQDFTSPVEYTVESASGLKQVWTVTVTVAI